MLTAETSTLTCIGRNYKRESSFLESTDFLKALLENEVLNDVHLNKRIFLFPLAKVGKHSTSDRYRHYASTIVFGSGGGPSGGDASGGGASGGGASGVGASGRVAAA